MKNTDANTVSKTAVVYDGGTVRVSGSSYYRFDDEQTLLAIIQDCLDQTDDEGVLRDYQLRYLRVQTPLTTRIAFTDSSGEQSTLRQLLRSSLLLLRSASVLNVILDRMDLLFPLNMKVQKRRRFDAIRQNGIGRAGERLTALDGYTSRTCARNFCTAGGQKTGQIDDLRLTGGVLDHGDALCPNGGQHGVFRCADAGAGQCDLRAGQSSCAAVNGIVRLCDLRAECAEGKQMIVHRPCADGTAARQAQRRFALSCKQRTEKQAGRAHGRGQLRRDRMTGAAARVYVDAGPAALGLAAETAQNGEYVRHVENIRTVMQHARRAAQERRGQNGQDAVFRSVDRHLAGRDFFRSEQQNS